MTSSQFLPEIASRLKQKHSKPCIALHSCGGSTHQERLFDISHGRLYEAAAYWVEGDGDSVYNGKCPFGLPPCYFSSLAVYTKWAFLLSQINYQQEYIISNGFLDIISGEIVNFLVLYQLTPTASTFAFLAEIISASESPKNIASKGVAL